MMTLKIESTPITPEVLFDVESRKFLIKGRSMPENAEGFYKVLLDWLKENIGDSGMKASIDMVMDYYNTGSFIQLMALFNLLYELNKTGNELDVRWFCQEDDQDVIDDGISFEEVVKVPFSVHII